MTTAPQLPTGETLPQYDDEHPEGVDIETLRRWLNQRYAEEWGAPTVFNEEHRSMWDAARRDMIRQVLAALQAVGDATLVKNGTYRAMRRDSVEIERLAAWLANHGFTTSLVEHGGNPVSVTITALTAAQAMVAKLAGLFGRAWASMVKDEV